jgi:O-antigen/teichoic acid export membrane protein
MRMPRSAYCKNVITVLAGATGAQALPMLVAPLLTRLCTPAEMGAFSVWLGVIAVTSIVATLRFEAAMVLDHGGRQQGLCFRVVAWSATWLALALTAGTVAARLLGLPVLEAMSWLELLTVGAGTWLTATVQLLLAYAASHNLFGPAAKAKIVQAGTIALSQVALLYAGLDSAGLLLGQLIGLGAGLAAARWLLTPPKARFAFMLDKEQCAYLVRHQAFWRYSLPSSLLNAVVGQLPLFMIGMHHGVAAAGLFALTQRVLSAPISLIASSVLEVFKRQAVVEFQSAGNCRAAYRATFRTLLLLALGPSLILFLFSPALFSWIFGAEWRPAGELARILAPLYFLNFLASPLSYVFFVVGRQKMELRWQVALFVVTLTVFLLPFSLHESLLAYAIGRSGLYVLYLCMSYWCARNAQAPQAAPARYAVRRKRS